jgi:hypothetical protein
VNGFNYDAELFSASISENQIRRPYQKNALIFALSITEKIL